MNETVVIQMGCIVKALPFPDLEKLPLLLETLERISHCGWSESQVMYSDVNILYICLVIITLPYVLFVQLQRVWRAVASYNNLTAQQLGAAEMVALNTFICGLNSSEIAKLEPKALMLVLHLEDLQLNLYH